MTLSTILIVDDDPANLLVLSQLLRPMYTVRAVNSGTGALRAVLGEPRPDLVLLDVMMPEVDGYTVLKRLRENPATEKIPVIFLTAMTDARDEERGLQLGAADYIAKPIVPAVVLARVRTQIQAKRLRDMLHDQNAFLEAEVSRRMSENDLTQRVSILALAHLAETRDPETGYHILRTREYVRLLAARLAGHPRFTAFLTPRNIDLATRSAPLHDIGKVGIPDSILLKPGPLTPEERGVMQTHAALGARAIELAEADAEAPVPFFALAKEIAHWHHEHWDGGGYPDGLVGDAIPASARLMALADVFDALVSPRVYKGPMSFTGARDIIAAGRAKQFDPDVTDAFLAGFADFTDIAGRYVDAVEPTATK